MKRREVAVFYLVMTMIWIIFFFVPVTTESWTQRNPKGPLIQATALVSPSVYLLEFGMLYEYTVTINHAPTYHVSYSWVSKCPEFPFCG